MKLLYLTRLMIMIAADCLCWQPLPAQQLPFENFSVDRGLIQSQVLTIAQDVQHHLWLGTFAGIDRFDGSVFTHFTKSNGLNSSTISFLYAANTGPVYAGTAKGISAYENGELVNYPVEGIQASFYFTAITEDNEGTIWALIPGSGLYQLRDKRLKKSPLPFKNATVTTLCRDVQGNLVISIYQKGIYKLTNSGWQLLYQPVMTTEKEFVAQLKVTGNTHFITTSTNRVLKYSGSQRVAARTLKEKITSCCVDDHGDLWLGTGKGVLLLSADDLHPVGQYQQAAGLSGNMVVSLFKDLEGNIWIGTDGDGLFKFSRGSFTKYDNRNGLPGNIVMGIEPMANGQLCIGMREGGIVNYDLNNRKIISSVIRDRQFTGINCIGPGPRGEVLIGTTDNKLVRFNGRSFYEIRLDKNVFPYVNTIYNDPQQTWLTTTAGCYYISASETGKLKGLDDLTIGVVTLASGETLVGTNNGVYSVDKSKLVSKLAIPGIPNPEVRCLYAYRQFILIGTSDAGIIFWDRQRGTAAVCDMTKGLLDNQIYCMLLDSRNVLWVGSGTGVQQVNFDQLKNRFDVRKFSKAEGYENAESNLNAIHEDPQGNIWIGTTRGVFIFNPAIVQQRKTAPYIEIQKVQTNIDSSAGLRSKQVTAGSNPTGDLALTYRKNSISFTVKGIYLNDPAALRYSCQLVGYDTNFSSPSNQTFYNYQSLQPGRYIFRVKAITLTGIPSLNLAEYAFRVKAPFYQSNWVIFLIVLLLIATGIVTQTVISHLVKKRKLKFELLRQHEEARVREQTSEDFHDELGNKLTRISLLADILQKKTDASDVEKNKLIQQIRENTGALYSGTKDIIWSLSAGNDNLQEVLERVRTTGGELFEDSGIDFSMRGTEKLKQCVLPTGYGRNVVMLFKELMNNSLRHAMCSTVSVRILDQSAEGITICYQDNGKGFDEQSITRGNGLNNIQRRAARTGGHVDRLAMTGNGTGYSIFFKLPFTAAADARL